MQSFVAYYRVSSGIQERSGLGLDAQRATVRQYADPLGAIIEEFTEIESGSVHERPQLHAALAACRRRGAVLLIAKLDRLARSVSLVSSLMDGNVRFIACDMPEANRLTLHLLAAVAEHEREMISQRTKAALAIAKARGVKLGNPRAAVIARQAAQQAQASADRFARQLAPLVIGLQAQGIHGPRALARELNARSVKTRGGGLWHASTAANLLKRIASE